MKNAKTCEWCKKRKATYTAIPCPCTKDNFYQVRDNWQGPGYRLYYGGERYVSQVDGEINGHVFDTVRSAKAYCLKRFGKIAKRTR